MNENMNTAKAPSKEKPLSSDTSHVPVTKDIDWQLPAISCFSFGLLSCLPLANTLFHLGIDNFFLLLLLLFMLLSMIPSGLFAVAIGKGSGSDWLEKAKTNVYHKIPIMTWTKRKKANPVK